MNRAGAHILLVEDNPADVRLMRVALEEATTPCELDVAADGDAAIELLRHRAGGPDARLPDLVILDLNLPRRSGLEVLAEIRADDRLRRLPVVVLTTSSAQRDLDAAYAGGANAYVVKPLDFREFRRIVAAIDAFWFQVAELPDSERIAG